MPEAISVNSDSAPPPPPPPPPPMPPPIVRQSDQPHYDPPPGSEPSFAQKLKKFLGPIGVALILLLKFGAKLKFLVIPLIKFLPMLLKTGGTMILSVGAYALAWGWRFALGFVLLIFIHECGHLVAARQLGLKVGAPVFIPFMGAFIALKEAPRDAWVESWVGIGGPLLGALGAAICELIYTFTGHELFRALAFTGFFLNLFNLAPIGFLDGGRIAAALSPWLWLVGTAIMIGLLVMSPNIIVALIVLISLPRLFSLFKKKSSEERRYYEVPPARRLAMAGMYFGLIACLLYGMHQTHMTHITPP